MVKTMEGLDFIHSQGGGGEPEEARKKGQRGRGGATGGPAP